MRKTILAALLATIAIAGCEKDNDQDEAIPSIEGLFGGDLLLNGSSDTGEALLRIFPGNELRITAFVDVPATEPGNWQLQGTSFKAIISNGNNGALKMDATWDASARSLNGILTDSGNQKLANIKLTQRDALPVEGTYNGLLGLNRDKPSKKFSFTVKPGGVIVDNNGATGTWNVINDNFTASLPAFQSHVPYTINAFYNLTTGTIRGNWLNDTAKGTFKVSKGK